MPLLFSRQMEEHKASVTQFVLGQQRELSDLTDSVEREKERMVRVYSCESIHVGQDSELAHSHNKHPCKLEVYREHIPVL